jgi:uncharacterized membrane protein
VALAVATLFFTLLPPLSETPVRVPLGLLMVLFVPGYTLIAALFPRKDDLDGIERVALSFGLSIAVVPLMGLGLNYTPWGIRLTPVVVSISLFTIVMADVAYFRRNGLPPHERFSVEFLRGFEGVKSELTEGDRSRLDKALTIVLVLSIILSISALVYVIVTPKQGEKFTEFYILGPNGKAYDYPTKVISGNKSTVIVGVVNHEYATVNYTMWLRFDNATVGERRITIENNETWEQPVTYVLSHPGDEQKLEFLLYKEDNFTAPYRDLHLWVNVTGTNMSGGVHAPATANASAAHNQGMLAANMTSINLPQENLSGANANASAKPNGSKFAGAGSNASSSSQTFTPIYPSPEMNAPSGAANGSQTSSGSAANVDAGVPSQVSAPTQAGAPVQLGSLEPKKTVVLGGANGTAGFSL